MPVLSKESNQNLLAYLIQLFFGTSKRQTTTLVGVALVLFYTKMKLNVGVNGISNKVDTKVTQKKGKGNVDMLFLQRLYSLIKIVIPSWKSLEVLDIVLLTGFLVLRTFLSIYIASVNGKIVNAVVKIDFKLFIQRILNLLMIALPASFINSYLDYLAKRIAIRFRTRLTTFFHEKYVKDMIFYQISNLDSRISNPDQRLTADLEKWASCLSQLYSNVSKPFLDIILFSKKLSDLVGWRGPFYMSAWYFLSGILLRFISPPFGRLTAMEQRLEGEYRACHTDLLHHAEEIAFYKGQEWEKNRINQSFDTMVQHSVSVLNKKLYMGFFDAMLVKYGAILVGYSIVGLPVFGPGREEYIKRIGTDPSLITRDYVRNSSLLINLAKAIGRIIVSYKEMQHLAGYTSLVYELKDVITDLSKGKYERTMVNQNKDSLENHDIKPIALSKGEIIELQNIIKFDEVPIISPNGDILVPKISFEIQPGMNCVITGPNGCGKSSLFRILGTLWPIFGGKLTRPPMDKLFYIPQRPYLPVGTLRDQIIYPHSKLLMRRRKVKDDDLKSILEIVQISYLIEREGGFDSVNDWNDVLSGGEKQRMAMARLFYHKPQYAILDECTSAVSIDIEAILYNHCKTLGITLFTVSHRTSIFKFHDYLLKFDGEGNWSFEKLIHEQI